MRDKKSYEYEYLVFNKACTGKDHTTSRRYVDDTNCELESEKGDERLLHECVMTCPRGKLNERLVYASIHQVYQPERMV